MDTLTELMDETVWHLPGRSPMAGDYEGTGATLAYFGQLAEKTGGTFRAELKHVAAVGDNHVVGIQRSTADRNSKHLDVDNSIVFELKDGRVIDGREHFEDLYAWDEFRSWPCPAGAWEVTRRFAARPRSSREPTGSASWLSVQVRGRGEPGPTSAPSFDEIGNSRSY